MSTIEIRTLPLRLELRDGGDGRTVAGLAVPYGVEVDLGPYRETFVLGAFAGTDPATVPLTATHPRDGGELPIGVAVELVEQRDGLHAAFRVSDTALGNDVLALVADRAVNGLSIGFIADPASDVWSRDRTSVQRHRATLDHVAVVRAPAYPTARITAVRAERASARLALALLRRAA
jgi:uncharacterized protein